MLKTVRQSHDYGNKKGGFGEHLFRYLKASRAEKKEALDHLVAVLVMPRKSVIRALRREQMRDRMRPEKETMTAPIYTLNYTDAATYLVIPRAQCSKRMEATKESMKTIRERMPFSWLGAHPDTGRNSLINLYPRFYGGFLL